MSLSTQQTLKSLAMTPEFEKRFAAANGVIVPSKVPQGEQPQKKRPMRVEKPTWEKKAKMTCIICGSARRDLRGLRDHFVVCVGRNGNPNGACWDDSLNPDYAANKRFDIFPSHFVLLSLISCSSSHTSTSLKDSAPAAALSNEHLAKLKRHRKTEECLAAVNGIVIQSKLSAGQAPNQGDYERNERQVHPCIICDRRFATRDQVGLHFSACVKRNGNPNGARWNDAWNSAASPVGHTGTQSRSEESQLVDRMC